MRLARRRGAQSLPGPGPRAVRGRVAREGVPDVGDGGRAARTSSVRRAEAGGEVRGHAYPARTDRKIRAGRPDLDPFERQCPAARRAQDPDGCD